MLPLELPFLLLELGDKGKHEVPGKRNLLSG